MADKPLSPGGYKCVIDNPGKVEVVKDRGEGRYRKDHPTRRDTIPAVEPNPDIKHSVSNGLFKAQELCFLGHKNTFVPRDQFEKIVTLKAVSQIVSGLKGFKDWGASARLAKIQKIYYGDRYGNGQCRKLLSALLVARYEDELDTLMQQGMNDDCFPLSITNEGGLHCRMHNDGHTGIDTLLAGLETVVTWSQRLTPVYITWEPTSRHRHYLLEDGDPLPMIKVGGALPDEGGYSEVTRVKIDDSGGKFQDRELRNADRIYAVKKLKRQNGDDARKHRVEFDLEVLASIYARSRTKGDSASKAGDFQHNIIPLLATFEIRDLAGNSTYYLLFDCAKGNLKQFWERHKEMTGNSSFIPWMATQFYQLIGALQSIHNDRDRIRSDKTWSSMYGRHGDIKPSNFLYFESGGEMFLVICDLGLGRLHRENTRFQPAADAPMTATYRSPEFDVKTWSNQLSSKSDMYSMACVFLEHITWFLLGQEAVEEFAEARVTQDKFGFMSDIFFTASDDLVTATVKKQVREWIERLRNHDNCCEYLNQLLHIIEKEMLEPNPNKRIGAPALLLKLEKLNRIIDRSKSFYTEHWKERRKTRKLELE